MDDETNLIFETYKQQLAEDISRKKTIGDIRYAQSTPSLLYSIVDAVKGIEDESARSASIDKICELTMGRIDNLLDTDFIASRNDFQTAIAKLIRKSIKETLPSTPDPARFREDVGFVKRDFYAARGFIKFLSSPTIAAIDLGKKAGKPVVRPEQDLKKRKSGMSRAHDKIKTAANNAISDQPSSAETVGFSVRDEYRIDRELPGTVSDNARMLHQHLVQEVGAGIDSKTGTELRKIASVVLGNLDRGDAAIKELMNSGAIYKKDEEEGDITSGPSKKDLDDAEKYTTGGDNSWSDNDDRYAAQDYYDQYM